MMKDLKLIDGDWGWDEDFPLSQAVKVGGMLYLSGQVAIDREGKVAGEGDLVKQSRQCFENMKVILNRAGTDFKNVVKLTTYFTVDIAQPELTRAYWEVRKEYFGSHRPASTGVQVKNLIYSSLMLEVEAIAVIPE